MTAYLIILGIMLIIDRGWLEGFAATRNSDGSPRFIDHNEVDWDKELNNG